VKAQGSEQEQQYASLSSNSFSSQAWKTVYRSWRRFKPIYLRCQLFSYWVEVFNEATFLMCKGVETVNTVIWTHATVANTTKWQSVNCNTKSSLTAFKYFLWCRFDMWNRWEKTDVNIKTSNTLSEYHIYPPIFLEISNVTEFSQGLSMRSYTVPNIQTCHKYIYIFLCATICILHCIVPMVR